MTRRVCFFHRTDLDGHCSGALVKMAYPETELVGIDYADGKNAEMLIRKHNLADAEVWMVDFSLQPFVEMLKLVEGCKKLIWCDHHKSAIEEYKKNSSLYNGEFERYIDPNYKSNNPQNLSAGCELTFKALEQNPRIGEKIPPRFVKLLGRFDVWDHTDQDVIPFQYGMREVETNPCKLDWSYNSRNIWQALIYNHQMGESYLMIEKINCGKTILSYVAKDNKGLSKSSWFLCHVGDLKCMAVNKLGGNSQVFDAVWNPEEYDAMLLFGFNGKMWRVSLYTTKDVDVGAVCKKLGGGGHAKAAGFTRPDFPFECIGLMGNGRSIMRLIP